jgi:hypothetical protein
MAAFGQSAGQISDHDLCAADLFATFRDGTYKWRDVDDAHTQHARSEIRGRRSPSLEVLLAD